jgi:hypothetical protein
MSDWEPPAGMVKRRCGSCGHQFATRDAQAPLCPTCKAGGRSGRKSASVSPFDPDLGYAGRLARSGHGPDRET